jgi:polyisoprenoid-binding protein YceI
LLKIAAPALLVAAAVPLLAQMPMQAPGKPDKSLVVSGTYNADPDHSLIGWRLNHLGFNDYFGLLGYVKATLVLDPAHLESAKVTATIPVSKIMTVNSALNAELLKPAAAGGKPQFFGANPADATYVSTSVVPGADGTSATINGNLTLNGVTKPVAIAATFVGAGPSMMTKAPSMGFHGKATIKRSEFGLGYGVPLVSDQVDLEITIAFEKTR